MVSSTYQTTYTRLQLTFTKQNAHFSAQNLRDLTTDELEQYVSMRNACVHYIKSSHVVFDTKPDTFATALGILDVFLWKVKISEKHMTIVCAACYLLACKIKEEEEVIPTPSQLASFPSHLWTANDLCRMEMHILSKLNWTISTVTYIDYLPLLCELYGVNTNDVCCDRYIYLAERCISSHSTVLLKPLVLALHLFQQVLDQIQLERGETCKIAVSQLDIKDFKGIDCSKELPCNIPVSSITISPKPAVPKKFVFFPVKLFDKPSEIGSTCLPTISEE